MEKQFGVLVLCSNRLLRESIARILSKRAEFRVIAALAIGSMSAVEIASSGADVLVLDSLQFVLKDEIYESETGRSHRARKCVLIAMDDDEKHFLSAIRSGVQGYVLQDASADDVVGALRAVAHGEAVCPHRFTKLLFDSFVTKCRELPNRSVRNHLGLTRREQALIPMIGRGLTNKEIAVELNLSEQTVKNHVHRILRKVGVGDRLSVKEAFETQSLYL